MNKIAWITHGRIRCIFNTPFTLEEWKFNHSPKNLYIDVTHQNAFVGDDILIDENGNYQILPKEQWFLHTDPEENTPTLSLLKKRKLKEVEVAIEDELWKAFRLQSSYYPRLMVHLENDAITYLKTNEVSSLLQEVATSESLTVSELVDEILKCRRKALEINDRVAQLYVKYKDMIEAAKTEPDLLSITVEQVKADAIQ